MVRSGDQISLTLHTKPDRNSLSGFFCFKSPTYIFGCCSVAVTLRAGNKVRRALRLTKQLSENTYCSTVLVAWATSSIKRFFKNISKVKKTFTQPCKHAHAGVWTCTNPHRNSVNQTLIRCQRVGTPGLGSIDWAHTALQNCSTNGGVVSTPLPIKLLSHASSRFKPKGSGVCEERPKTGAPKPDRGTKPIDAATPWLGTSLC